MTLKERQTTVPETARPTPHRPRRLRTLRAVLSRPLGTVSLALIALVILGAVLAPLAGSPEDNDYTALMQGPSAQHLLGTDSLGRDVLARVLYGARVSLIVAVASAVLALLVGVAAGVAAGWHQRWLDTLIGRVADLAMAFPTVIVGILLAVLLGPSIVGSILAIALGMTPVVYRVARARVMQLKQEGYVTAALADGASTAHVLRRHVLPNLTGLIIVQAAIALPVAIIGESLLSYLGLGVRPPTPSWGDMLSDAQPHLETAPWLALAPGIAIVIAALSTNLLGDVLRDELDPRTKGRS